LGTVPVKVDSSVSREPDVVFGAENYLVVWSDGTFGGAHKVQAARVTPDGVVLDSGVFFGMDAYCEYRPAVAFDGQRFFAVWYNYDYTPAGLFGRFISTACQPEGHELPIRVLTQGALLEPDIAFGDSSYLVVWHEPSPYYDDDVYGQIVSTQGAMLGDVIPIATGSAYQYLPRVCAGDSDFLVVWNQNYAIYGQWLSMAGELIGTNFPISDTASCTRDYPAVAMNSTRCFVTWHQFNNGNYDIFGNLDTELGLAQKPVSGLEHKALGATILTGPLFLPQAQEYRVFDITGRLVDPLCLCPGIYFIEDHGTLVRKIVKIR